MQAKEILLDPVRRKEYDDFGFIPLIRNIEADARAKFIAIINSLLLEPDVTAENLVKMFKNGLNNHYEGLKEDIKNLKSSREKFETILKKKCGKNKKREILERSLNNYISEAVQKQALAKYQLEVHEKCMEMIKEYGDDWDEIVTVYQAQQQFQSMFFSTTAV